VAALLARRALWTVVDQALSSLGSLVLSIAVARQVDSDAFGAFTVAFSVYTIAVLVSRALVSQPMAIRFAAAGPAEYRTAAASSTGSAAAVAMAAGVVVLVVGLVLGDTVGHVLVTVALLLPALLVQDAWRTAFVAQGRPQWAAAIDAVWMGLLLVSVVALSWADVRSPVWFVLAWGLAAAAGSLLGTRGSGTWPSVRRTRSWLTDHWDLTRYLVIESLVVQGAFQGSLMLVGALASLSDVAALRGAQVVLGPVALLGQSAAAFVVPELARRSHAVGDKRLRVALAAATLMTTIGVLWGGLLLLLPDQVGEALLGDTWDEVQVVLVASIVGQLCNLFSSGATYVVYSMGESRAAMQVNIVVAVLLPTLGLAGLAVGGVVGVAWGYTLAYAAVVPLWFWQLSRIDRARRRIEETA
jgi:O-antigen/teichoic acid export membrane protein